jgi:hypothetical protein
VTVRDRVAQIVARFDYVPQLHGEVGTKEFYSYVNLPRKGALPFSAGCSKHVNQGPFDAEVPFQNLHDSVVIPPNALGHFFVRFFQARIVKLHSCLPACYAIITAETHHSSAIPVLRCYAVAAITERGSP